MFRILNAGVTAPRQTYPAEPEVELVRTPGHIILYDVNSMAAVEVTESIADEAMKGDWGFPGLIRWPFKPQFPAFSDCRPKSLVLEATHACNLGCRYCFVRNYYGEQAKMMDLETAIRAIALLPQDQQISVGFFGGEPTLNWKLIEDVVAYVRTLAEQRKVGCHFHVTTNGIALDEKRIAFLDEHGFSIIVSLDGPEEIHNRNRPHKSEAQNSHALTLANLRLFAGTKTLRHHTTLRSTYTGEATDLVERLDYLNALVDEGLASHVSVEPCSLNESACLRLPDGHPLSITPKHYDALRVEYHNAAEWFVGRIRGGKKPRFHHFYKPIERMLWTLHSPSECGAGRGYLAVDPSGNIYGCHRESHSAIGSLDAGIDEARRAPWMDNRYYARPDCGKCALRNMCGGGCRLDSLERYGDIHKPDETGCFFKRVMFENALWIMAEVGPERLGKLFPNPRARTGGGSPRHKAQGRAQRADGKGARQTCASPPPVAQGPASVRFQPVRGA